MLSSPQNPCYLEKIRAVKKIKKVCEQIVRPIGFRNLEGCHFRGYYAVCLSRPTLNLVVKVIKKN